MAVGADALLEPVSYLALLATLLSLAAGNVANDMADLREDRINRPHRPLVRGDVSFSQARKLAIALALLALALAQLIHFTAFLFVLCCQLSLLWYALQGKQSALLGNILVSILVALSVLFAAMVHGAGSLALEPAILAFAVNLMRELVKDMQDLEGDIKAGRRTLPMLCAPSCMRVILVTIAIIPLLFLVALQTGFNLSIHTEPIFVYLRLFLSLLMLLGVFYTLRADLSSALACGRFSARLKAFLTLGLTSYWIAILI